MNEPDLSALQQELTALRLIVYSLLEQNELRKNEIQGLKQQINAQNQQKGNLLQPVASPQTIDSLPLQQDAPYLKNDSLPLQQDVSYRDIDSLPLRQVTLYPENDSLPLQDDASFPKIDSLPLQQDASPQEIYTNPLQQCGINSKMEGELLQPVEEHRTLAPLPLKLSLSPENIYPLARAMSHK